MEILSIMLMLSFVFATNSDYHYTNHSDGICLAGEIRIEVASSSTNMFKVFEIPNFIGYYLWRDEINRLGGICVGGDNNAEVYNECVGGMRHRVCLHVIELGGVTTTVDDYTKMLEDWIDEVSKRSNKEKPHFMLLPMGDEYNTILNKYISDKYGMYGFNIPTIGSCGALEAYSSNYHFAFSPIMKSIELGLPSIELFHKRLGYRRWMIIGDTITMQFSINSVQAIVDQYRDETGEMINLLEKRCEGDRSNFTGINCKSLNDCGSQENCVYPLVKTDNILVSDTIEEITKWLKLAQQYNPDVLILNVDSNLPSYLEILKNIGYTPNVIMSLLKSYVAISPRLYDIDNTYLYYATAFNEKQGYGNDRIKSYLGSSDSYVRLVSESLHKYINTTIDAELVDVEDDYEYIARGSLIGVTIQRLVELTSTLKNVQYDDDDLYFISNPVNRYYTVLHNKFDVCENEDGSYTQPCHISKCKSGCKPWKTFFGPVGFDLNGMNEELKSTLVQIQSYEQYKIPYIVSPSTSPVCNLDNHVCSESNGFSDCTCNFITPSPWSWSPKEKSTYFTESGILILLYIIASINLIIVLSLLLFSYKNKRKLRLCKIPFTMLLWCITPIVLAIYDFVIVGRPNTFTCSLEAFVYYTGLGVCAFVPYFVNKELHQKTTDDDLIINLEIYVLIIYYFLLCVNLIVSPIQSVYHSEIIKERIIYYYSCGEYKSNVTFSYFIWFLIISQIYYLIKGNLKRNKLVFYIQSYYLFLTLIFGTVAIVNNYIHPYERPIIIMLFIMLIGYGFCFIFPFIFVIFMKIAPSLLHDYNLTRLSSKRKELDHFLKNRIYRTHMISFGENIKMNNYIEFYYEIMKYERTKVKEELEAKAYSILTIYIENNYVELPLEIKANIMNHFSAVTIDIFNETKEYVFNLLLNDFWDKFVYSEYYETALDDQVYFKFFERRHDVILKSIYTSLGVSIMNEKLSNDEKDEIINIQRPNSSVYKLSRTSKSSKCNFRKSKQALNLLTPKISEISLK